jgi:hypothetical protein
MHDKIFVNPRQLSQAEVDRHVTALKLDPMQFRTCLDGAGTAQVNADVESGRALGVRGTPTFFVGKRQSDGRVRLVERVPGAVPFERWQEILNKCILEAHIAPLAPTFDLCELECGPDVSCEQACWVAPPELPLQESTCGAWEGPPWNGEGQCLGTCGDDFCNEYNNEEYGEEGCPEDCGFCGDDICDPFNSENSSTCYVDCRECGDDICDGELFENCGTCPEDCNPNQEQCGEGEPGEECDEGKCNNAQGHCCVPAMYDDDPDICSYCTASQQCLSGWNPGLGAYVFMCIEEGESCGDSVPSASLQCIVPEPI